ncbi:MAG: hypothetical protein HY080_15655 [Gammaproteobacteria bacterium]|nr:hypothetical protein [Gammaproteobacteria bacterium]
MRTDIVITIDVECALPGGALGLGSKPIGVDRRVFCKSPAGEFGIKLIIDLLNHFNMKGSFFCDSSIKYLTNDDDFAKVVNYIHHRQHDVQLHTHPIYRLWATKGEAGSFAPAHWSDNICDLPVSLQHTILQEGVELLYKHINKTPIAYRAGNYGANAKTLDLLRQLAIRFDSSYNIWARSHKRYSNQNITDKIYNTPFDVGGVLEVPVTNYYCGLGKTHRFFAPEGASAKEMVTALDLLHANNTPIIVIVLHSFSFALHTKQPDKNIKFNFVTYNRLKKLFKYISVNQHKFNVLTFSDIFSSPQKIDNYQATTPHREFVRVPNLHLLGRLFGQAVQKIL